VAAHLESHVGWTGPFALYEAWSACSTGTSTPPWSSAPQVVAVESRRVWAQQLDPTTSPRSAGPGLAGRPASRALLDREGHRARLRRGGGQQPRAALDNPTPSCAHTSIEEVAGEPVNVRNPLRRHDLPPISDGASAVVLARGDRARELTERPVWIRGFDHRIEAHQPVTATSPSRPLPRWPPQGRLRRWSDRCSGAVRTFSPRSFILRTRWAPQIDQRHPSGGRWPPPDHVGRSGPHHRGGQSHQRPAPQPRLAHATAAKSCQKIW